MTTFVTAYLKVYDEDYDNSRNFENRLKHFILLLELGINICIYIDPEFKETFCNLQNQYTNLNVINYMKIEDLELYKVGQENPELCNLPSNRNVIKDTQKYIFLMLAKLEFLKKTIDLNPYNADYFCWFDFSLPYIFKDTNNTLLKIKNIANAGFKKQFLCIPGCWHFKTNNLDYLTNNIVWRFCGGFLIGDKNSIIDFYNVSHNNFLDFLNHTKTIVWEVNYWAWLENNGIINPIWFLADHNDSIIDIPYELLY